MTIATKNKIILVTGAAGGIGRAICKALKAAHATVVATDLNRSEDCLCDLFLTHDITDAAQWSAIVGQIETKYGRLDGLVNAAGISIVAGVEQTSLAEWRRVQAINVESILIGTQACLPMLKTGGASCEAGASIVNFSSIAGLGGAAFNSAYCASKAAVQNFTKSCAIEFSMLKYNIRVNSVHPGGIETPMLEGIINTYVKLGAVPSYEEAHAGIVAQHPIGRLGRPDEISGGVVFLCSDAASFMTGSELIIDGGFTAP